MKKLMEYRIIMELIRTVILCYGGFTGHNYFKIILKSVDKSP